MSAGRVTLIMRGPKAVPDTAGCWITYRTIGALISFGNPHPGRAIRHMPGPVSIRSRVVHGCCPDRATVTSIVNMILCHDVPRYLVCTYIIVLRH